MNTYYCVNQKFFDSGYIKVLVYQVNADTKPKNGAVENRMCDEYHDYFESYEEAKRFAAEAKKESR